MMMKRDENVNVFLNYILIIMVLTSLTGCSNIKRNEKVDISKPIHSEKAIGENIKEPELLNFN